MAPNKTMAPNKIITMQNGFAQSHPGQSQRTRFGSQILNSGFMGSGALGQGDRGGNQFVSQMDSNPYNSNDYVYRWRSYCQLYETSWEARKIVRIPVEDALRKPWTIEGLDEEVATKILNKFNQLRGLEVLKRSLMLERLLGGCLTFMGLDGNEDDPSKPYSPKEGQELRFMNSIPISRIAKLEWDNNPLSEHYMRPHVYQINGTEIHVSRCLVWDGEPLFDPYDFILTNFRANLAGFGPSKLAPIWDDIIKAVGTRQAAYQMIQTNNSIIMAVQDLQDLAGTNPGKAQLAKLKEIANNLSLYRAAIIDGERVDITNTQASFGSVPELLMSFLQVLSAASDIPATRFLGQAPGGLNATGESDLENYYNMIDAYQRQRVEPNLRRTYDIIGYNMYRERWVEMRKDMKFVFPPLWNTKEGDQADLAGKRIDNALKLWQERAISDKKFIEEINAQGALSVTLDETDIDLMGEFRDEQSLAMIEGGQQDEGFGGGGKENPFGGGEQKGITSPQNPNDVTKQLTRLHNIANGINPDEFEMGMKDEQDHLNIVEGNESKLAEIVRDHLREDPAYYSKLKKAGLLRTTDTARMLKQHDDIDRHQNSKWEDDANTPFKWVDRSAAVNSAVVRYRKGNWTLEAVCNDVIEDESRNFAVGLFNMSRSTFQSFMRDVKAQLMLTGDFKNKSTRTNPTEAQLSAGNYKKEHYTHQGFDIAIENPAGSTRNGTDEMGRKWSQTMKHPYGYIKRTTGADGDHVDCFLGSDPDNGCIVVIDQLNIKTGKFDEHKVMFGFQSQAHALHGYLSNYDESGLERIGTLNPAITIEEFKQWLDEGDQTQPFHAHVRS